MRTFGIELTFVPTDPHSYHEDTYFYTCTSVVNNTDHEMNYIARYRHGNQFKTWAEYFKLYRSACKDANVQGWQKIYIDPGCIEFPSPVFQSKAKAKKWYASAIKAAALVGLTTYHEDQEGGGGHIHIGGLSDCEKLKVFKELYKHPYLAWIFPSPNAVNDNVPFSSVISNTMENIIKNNVGFNDYLAKNLRNYFDFTQVEVEKLVDNATARLTFVEILLKKCRISDVFDTLYVDGNKSTFVSNHYKYRTLEFRGFESPANWEEFDANLKFALAFVEYAIANNSSEKTFECSDWQFSLDPIELTAEYSKSKKLCIESFKLLLEDLGLEYDPYDWMVKRHLLRAFEWKAVQNAPYLTPRFSIARFNNLLKESIQKSNEQCEHPLELSRHNTYTSSYGTTSMLYNINNYS